MTSKLCGEIVDVLRECSAPGWDGDKAVPVDIAAALHATAFLARFDTDTPDPTVASDPDGSLTLEWYKDQKRLLSVSVSSDGKVDFVVSGSFHVNESPFDAMEVIQEALAQFGGELSDEAVDEMPDH